MIWEPLLMYVGTPSWALISSLRGNLLKLEWLVAGVTAVGSPNTSEGAIFRGDFG